MNHTTPLMLLVLSVLLTIAGIRILADTLQNTQAKSTHDLSQAAHLSEAIQRMDAALLEGKLSDRVQFSGIGESPFHKYNQAPVVNTKSPSKPEVKRKPLFLKGILIKSKPLAIIEDESGTTYIRGAGEQVNDQEVVDIKNNSVTLRDSKGTYELSVEGK